MTVRKTESRIPASFQASDLGEAVVAADTRCALVSFVTSPIVVGRENVYVVFVTDAGLAAAAVSFEWTVTENEGPPDTHSTPQGEFSYTPKAAGKLKLVLRILGAGNAEQAELLLEQRVVAPSETLEAFITQSQNSPGPGVGDPVVARELVNEYCSYYQNVELQQPEDGDSFKRFLFRMVSDGVTRRSATERRQHFERLATAVIEQPQEFARLAAMGAGVCSVRLVLLAMILTQTPGGPPFLPWKELPEANPQRTFADEQLRQSLATLSEDARIDLFNVARFPKSNISACGRILESLRDRYFGGTTFEEVITGISGTRAHWIVRHFLEGPLKRE